MRKLASVATAVIIAGLLAPLGPLSSASAAPASPVLTSPTSGASSLDNPVLGWNAVPGAARYDVQVSPVSDFSGTLSFSASTANTKATPPNDLPVGDYYWRVRALDSSSQASGFSTSTFTKAARNAPVLVAPDDNTNLVYPKDALYFQWNAMPGAKGYEIQIDDDSLFVGAPAPVATTNLSYAPTSPPVFGTTYWWRVRSKSNSNVYSQWSTPRSYQMSWSPTPVTLTSPPSTNSPTIEHVELDWEPMAGAAYYEVQVSPDANFNNPVVMGKNNVGQADPTRGRKVVGTRFSDNDTDTSEDLNLPAGAYYWRVRAMSTSEVAEPGPWSETRTFTRGWPATSTAEAALPNGALTAPKPSPQVTLLSPADGDYAQTEPRLSWTPQRGASHYEVQFSSDAAFSPSRVASCFTNHASLTPFWRMVPNTSTTCQPVNQVNERIVRPGVVVYWRVRAQDGPEQPATNGVFTEVRSFLYEDPNIDQVSPAGGATVTLPVLSWTPARNMGQYKVTISPVNPPANTSCGTVTAFTYNVKYVPETLDPKCPSWAWTVQGVEDNNNTNYTDGYPTRIGPTRVFTWNRPTGQASTPAPVTTTTIKPYLPPLMQWPSVIGATAYQVWYSKSGANSFSVVTSNTSNGTNATGYAFTGSQSTSLGRLLSTGDYDYFVRAIGASGKIGDSPMGTFHIDTLPGATLTAPANCPPASCTAVENDTPTFRWNPVTGAGLYILYLATDPNFTNITHEFRTVHTEFTPSESLPDSQAGQATYWYVRSCITPSDCGTFDTSVFPQARAFRKQSAAVETVAPLAGYQETTGEVRFAWRDYLYTNQDQGVSQEAAYYRVQISTSANFTQIVDTSPRVDQTEYTADLKTYPDGPLYWQVQAFDNSNNPLTFSTPIAFSKKLAPPTGLTPTNATSAPSAPLLSWDAMSYSAKYEVEIYKNPGDALSPTNRVASITTRSSSAVPTTALPAGSYGWRVRRIDINGNGGSWSAEVNTALASFTVQAPKPLLLSPTQGSTVQSSTLLLSWTSVPGATRYRVEASTNSGFTANIESLTTDLTSWAPGQLSPQWPNAAIYWRVTALDSSGAALATSSVGSFVRDRSTAGEFAAVSPYRVLDTRVQKSPLGSGQTRTVSVVGGLSGVPSTGVSAVVLNATVTGPTKSSYLTLWPAGTTRPTVSTVNFTAGQTVANHATVPVDGSGRISMFNFSGSTHVLLDVVGYYSNGALQRATRYTPATTPTRIADTRGGGGVAPRPLGAGEARLFEVAGLGGVPAGATAVVMNATAVAPTKAGFLTVYPAGSGRPTASNINFTPGANVPNLVTMPLGTGGDVMVFNSGGTTHVILDVVGWYQGGDPGPGARMNSITPARVADTRGAQGPMLSAGVPRLFQMRGQGGIPNDLKVTGVVLNVTVTGPTGSGYATVYPSGTSLPTASNLNYLTGQTVANQVIARVGSDGKIAVYSQRSANVVIDVVGWLG
ncbi:hypothetical protein RKE38_01360 [Phycicoccus sp. M110.8]|uniref:hypothetical protein n=1 Tax=Phycicoccus sp. M110.8 TaxID=3075433 RepID=UPI0028FD21E3|nr:hypothetical protein [Phycicoccus sp. M110.8]MDU0312317.1 hypothetical protein [Phycicoccus sp. M110.8]